MSLDQPNVQWAHLWRGRKCSAWWPHTVTSVVVDLSGWAPCSLDLPPWSLNAPVPCTECFLVGAVPGKVVSSTTHEAPLLLPLIVIHSLHHLHVQPLYLVELWQLSIRGLRAPYLRIWQEQLISLRVEGGVGAGYLQYQSL